MRYLNVSLIVWAKPQESVHEPQVLKRRERRAEADRTEVLLLASVAPYRRATPADSEVFSSDLLVKNNCECLGCRCLQ